MLDISTVHPYAACSIFAIDWLKCIADYRIADTEALIDVNDSGSAFANSFPPPNGFTYCVPCQKDGWTLWVLSADARGFCFEFEVPFAEPEFRPMVARFTMVRMGDQLQVKFDALVPS